MLSIKPTRKLSAGMDMTPMIDMVFNLLIYFILSMNCSVDEGISIHLPQAKSTTQQAAEDIIVYVDKSGKVYFKGNEISYGNLHNELRRSLGKDKQKLVIIKSDREVILDKAVKVMDIAKDAGAGKLCIATEDKR